MAEREVPINDCDKDLDVLKVYVGDTVRWANNTKRRIIIVLPDSILEPDDAVDDVDPGGKTRDYTVVGGSGRTHRYKFQCIGRPRLGPRTGTIDVG
jgi:plastocyanin